MFMPVTPGPVDPKDHPGQCLQLVVLPAARVAGPCPSRCSVTEGASQQDSGDDRTRLTVTVPVKKECSTQRTLLSVKDCSQSVSDSFLIPLHDKILHLTTY